MRADGVANAVVLVGRGALLAEGLGGEGGLGVASGPWDRAG